MGSRFRRHALADKHDHGWDGPEQTGTAFHWSAALTAGKTLEIRGINGSIDAVLAAGRDAGGGCEQDRASQRSRRGEDRGHRGEGSVLICARYPGPDGKLQDCGDQGHGNNVDVDNNDVNVRFQVRCRPASPWWRTT